MPREARQNLARNPHWLVRLAGYTTGLVGLDEAQYDPNFWCRSLAGVGPNEPDKAHVPLSRVRAPSSSTGQLSPETIIADRYRIVSWLAKGGMGAVYEAEDLTVCRHVALKILRPELAANPASFNSLNDGLTTFKQVATQRLYQNICWVNEIGRQELPAEPNRQIIYLTMELLGGETLTQLIDRVGMLPRERALPIVRDIACGLDDAHRVGQIHGDLKPANVLLTLICAVVTGFQFSQLRNESRRLGPLGLETPSSVYMAPELLEGGSPSCHTDIYSLGVIMYEMVTGRLPFLGNTPLETAQLRLKGPPPSPVEFAPSLPPAWDRTILRCLALDPAERFPGARDVVAALGEKLGARQARHHALG
jgi:serine/threonine protein kinase